MASSLQWVLFQSLFYLLFKINLKIATGFQHNLLLAFVIICLLVFKFVFLLVYSVRNGFTSGDAYQAVGFKIRAWLLT